MLSVTDHLLACLEEEAGEIAQVVGKGLRFGLDDANPKTNVLNRDLLKAEVHDVIAIWQLLCAQEGWDPTTDPELIRRKLLRTIKYINYAKERGRILPLETLPVEQDHELSK